MSRRPVRRVSCAPPLHNSSNLRLSASRFLLPMLSSTRNRALFASTVLVGLIARVVVGIHSVAIAHSDEHQQYLEVAQKLAFHGPAIEFWEQSRGVRNLIYPYFLALVLRLDDVVGIHAPLAQAASIRVLLGTVGFLLFARLAWRYLQQRRPVVGLAALVLFGLLPPVVYFQARCLSENAIIIPLIGALLLMPRRPFWAGICLGLMFAVRFQSAFISAGIICVAILDDRIIQRGRGDAPLEGKAWLQLPSLRLAAGTLLALCLSVGLFDRLTLGGWFHSPVEYLTANVLENRAAKFGVSPWYQYFIWLGEDLWRGTLLVSILLVPGIRRQWRLFVPVAFMILGHSAVGHKEQRFIWSIAPLLALITAEGFAAVWHGLSRVGAQVGWARGLFTVVALACLVLGGLRTYKDIEWKGGYYYYGSALSLDYLRQQDDVRGVLCLGVPRYRSGNYFFLRKPIPLLYAQNRISRSASRKVNYVLSTKRAVRDWKEQLSRTTHRQVQGPVAKFGNVAIYRLVPKARRKGKHESRHKQQ